MSPVGPIIFARHAESEANAAGLINADPTTHNSLSERGAEQAKRLSEELRDVPVDLCFASQLLRATQTAAVAMAGRAISVIELADLNEPAAGEFEGGPVDTYNDWVVTNGYWAPNPRGESQVEALCRFLCAFRRILDHPADRIVVVAHALPIAWLREGVRASVDGATDLGLNFKEPGVDLATPYTFSRDEVAGAVSALNDWLDHSRGEP